MQFPELNRITRNYEVMGRKPCIRGMRVTVDAIDGLVKSGATHSEILKLYPYLEEDIHAAVKYTAHHSEEHRPTLPVS